MATIVVTNNADSGPGSLRQAILDASNPLTHPGPDTILFVRGVISPITLTSELLVDDPTGALTITGPGANLLTISGGGATRVLDVAAGSTINISGLTIANGRVTGSNGDGGVGSSGGAGGGSSGGDGGDAGVVGSDGSDGCGSNTGGGGGPTPGSGTGGSGGIGEGGTGGAGADSGGNGGGGGGFGGAGGGGSGGNDGTGGADGGGGGGGGGGGDSGSGGGVLNAGTLVVTACTFSGNEAIGGTGGTGANGSAGVEGSGGSGGGGGGGGGGYGGAIFNQPTANLTVTASTFSTNMTAGGNGGPGGDGATGGAEADGGDGGGGGGGGSSGGGAIFNCGRLTATNCTFSANAASNGAGGDGGNGGDGGFGGGNGGAGADGANDGLASGAAVLNLGIADLSFITVANSLIDVASSGAISNALGGVLRIKNSLIANTQDFSGNPQVNCDGIITDLGGNISSPDVVSCLGFMPVTAAALNLQPLALNPPGTTETHALGLGSAAINAAIDCTDVSGMAVSTDQRGVRRPQGATCDVGAYEREAIQPRLLIGLLIKPPLFVSEGTCGCQRIRRPFIPQVFK